MPFTYKYAIEIIRFYRKYALKIKKYNYHLTFGQKFSQKTTFPLLRAKTSPSAPGDKSIRINMLSLFPQIKAQLYILFAKIAYRS